MGAKNRKTKEFKDRQCRHCELSSKMKLRQSHPCCPLPNPQNSQAEIDALGIELKVNGKTQFKTDSSMKNTKGVIKNLVRLNRR